MGVFGSSQELAFNDYERACEISEYIEVIQCNNGLLAVLGDEPLQSAFFCNADKKPCVVRLVYRKVAYSDSFIFELSDIKQIGPSIKIPIWSGSLLLLDSSSPYANLDRDGDHINVTPGDYVVTAEKFERPGEISLIIHRFLRVGSSS